MATVLGSKTIWTEMKCLKERLAVVSESCNYLDARLSYATMLVYGQLVQYPCTVPPQNYSLKRRIFASFIPLDDEARQSPACREQDLPAQYDLYL